MSATNQLRADHDQVRRLEKIVSKSKAYKDWADKLEGNAKADLASMGLVNFLTQIETEENQNQNQNQ